MILVGGAVFLEAAEFVLAQELVPEEQLAILEGPGNHCCVYPCKQHLIFDFIGYWWYTQHNTAEYAPGLIRDLEVIAAPT